jgi:hypothetical protein
MSGDLGLGFLLNLVFWALMVTAAVFIGAWVAAELFPGTARKFNGGIRGRLGRKQASNPPGSMEHVDEEGYRKAS